MTHSTNTSPLSTRLASRRALGGEELRDPIGQAPPALGRDVAVELHVSPLVEEAAIGRRHHRNKDRIGPAMILITGASGTIGREVVKALGARGAPTRAAYRTRPQNVPAGVESVALDYDRPETIRPALEGVQTLF